VYQKRGQFGEMAFALAQKGAPPEKAKNWGKGIQGQQTGGEN